MGKSGIKKMVYMNKIIKVDSKFLVMNQMFLCLVALIRKPIIWSQFFIHLTAPAPVSE